MPAVTVELSSVAGTEAALGRAGGHTITVDRPDGRAGGRGLGFNGAELLGLAIGGCLCNDLRYVAHDLGVALGGVAVSVTVEMEGDPLIVTSAGASVACDTLDGSDPQPVIDRARRISTVATSIARGVPVDIRPTPAP